MSSTRREPSDERHTPSSSAKTSRRLIEVNTSTAVADATTTARK